MFSKPLALVLLALGCLTAAAGGAYVANRHNSTDTVAATAPAGNPASAQSPSQPVAETEAAVSGTSVAAPKASKAEADPAPVSTARRAEAAAPKLPPIAAQASGHPRNELPAARPVQRTVPMNGSGTPAAQPQAEPQAAAWQPPAPPAPEPAKAAEVQPESPKPAQFEEVILPAASVIGLQLEMSLSSERARVEDRVEARVSRDVMAAGRVAIPAGARVIGSVIEVDKGGKVKTPAHIGIRFHTLVLSDGSEVALRTEPIFRDAESPAAGSARKIGGAAIAGAILGGIMGGGKGAATGSAIGAAGGTAAVMSGERTIVSMPAGQLMTAKLSAPATVTIERRE